MDLLGLADFSSHLDVGKAAAAQANLQMTPEQRECFLRGLLSPDLPDLEGIAGMHTEVPIAEMLAEGINIAEKVRELKKLANEIENMVPTGIRDAAGDLISRLRIKPVEGAKFWWNDSSSIGPLLNSTPIVKNAATVETHFGDNQYMHGMGSATDKAADIQKKMQETVDGLLAIYCREKCCAGYVALGKAVHILTDSWTLSHVVRNADDSISQFIVYTEESAVKHKAGDNLRDPSNQTARASAISSSAKMISGACDGTKKNFFPLSDGASVGVPPGMGPMPFSNIPHGPPR